MSLSEERIPKPDKVRFIKIISSESDSEPVA